jgi:hypothetical protein
MDRAGVRAGPEDVGDQTLIRGLGTAFPFVRPGLTAQSLPVVIVFRLTIYVARKSLRTETDASENCRRQTFLRMQSKCITIAIRWGCGWNSLHTKARRLLEQLTLAT